LVSYGPFEVAIVTNIRMRLKFEVARTPQVAVQCTFVSACAYRLFARSEEGPITEQNGRPA